MVRGHEASLSSGGSSTQAIAQKLAPDARRPSRPKLLEHMREQLMQLCATLELEKKAVNEIEKALALM
jgi:hypothetical protein